MRRLPAIVLGVLVAALPDAPALARADSFTPVRLQVTIAAVARLHVPLAVTVAVNADASVLDDATAPLRIRVRLARECGGTFASTTGPVLLDQELNPQPNAGRSYSASAHGTGAPTSFGVQSVCVYLEEEGDDRMFANNTFSQVDVSPVCTASAARYDSIRRVGPVRVRARRAAERACGAGVKL